MIIVAADGAGGGRTKVDGTAGPKTADNPTGQRIQVEFDRTAFSGDGFQQAVGHEGSHAADGADWAASGFAGSKQPFFYQSEVDAFTVQSLLIEAQHPNKGPFDFDYSLPYASGGKGKNPYVRTPINLYSSGWAEADKATLRS